MSEGKDAVYTWQEVGIHNKEDDLWVVIHGEVFDLTKYAPEHPGGSIVLENKAGRHASMAFDQVSHSKNTVQNLKPKYRIGRIDEASPIADSQKEAVSSSPNMLVTVGIILLILGVIYLLAS